MKLLNYNDILDKKTNFHSDDLFKNLPFFENFYFLIFINDVDDIILINDYDIIKSYIGNDFNDLFNSHFVLNHTSFCKPPFYNKNITKFNLSSNNPPDPENNHFNILSSHNDLYCLYIEKKYIWDNFLSIGVITILSSKESQLDKFMEIYYKK